MEAILYFFIFLIGTVFGSFFTLAVYRIPIGEDITHKHSFCPKCNHKLQFLDMIPIFSYIFLKGKCRYCKEPIRIRYLLLELLSGIVFLLLAVGTKIDLYCLNTSKIIYFTFLIFYIVSLFIIAGIDKERKQIQKSVLIFGLITNLLYMIYLYIVEKANVYRYVIYLFVIFLLLIITKAKQKKGKDSNYTLQILSFCFYMASFTGEKIFILTVALALLLIAITQSIKRIKQKNNKYIKAKNNMEILPIGFYLAISNIIMIIMVNISTI